VNGKLLIILFARLILAITLAVAGFLKYRDQSSFVKAVIEFGVPRRSARLLASLLPALEIVTAILLVVGDPFHTGSISAVLLLIVFTLAVAISLFRGLRPHCRCFGQVSSKPIGWATVVRNLLLLGLAAVCFLPPTLQWSGYSRYISLPLSTFLVTAALAVITTVLVAEGWIIFLLLRQQGKLLTRLEQLESRIDGNVAPAIDAPVSSPGRGLAVGSPAPNFQLPTLSGALTSLESFRANGLPVLLIFTNPHCDACNKLLPKISSWQAQLEKVLTVVLISEGRPDDNREKLAVFGLDRVLMQKRYEVATDFHVELTPSALIVGVDGDISSPVFAGALGIAFLVRRATQNNRPGAAPAPSTSSTPSGPRR
jgi:methylamine dehydrogenase accessory protein MauD